ncbi:MAG TPA: S8 family serine peptidase, partial [Thermoanaerobaculia bacterium]|nr:S8 family serine peptidase [Thermoanaerobaculia bacterium]
YILDSGIDASDLEFGSRAVNAYTAIQDGSGNPLHGDCNGHGTKAAKALGGSVSGVAKDVTLNAVRVGTVCNCSPGTTSGQVDPPLVSTGSCDGVLLSDALDGINWVTAHRVKPAVANLSFGGGAVQSLDNAVQGMINAGVVVVAAAGNSGVSACNVSPARVAGALTVGASDENDARSIWSATQSSNFGSCVDLFAPGTNLTMWNTTPFNGTSAAAPLVAGAVARYLQSTPAATPGQAHSYIVNNATTGRLTGIGTGSPNRLLFSPPGGTEIDNPPIANFNVSCSGRTCTFTNTSTDDFRIGSCDLVFGDPYNFQPTPPNCSGSHTYVQAGSYSVTLNVSDDAWQTSQKVRIVTVN